ncbi:MAG: hypothetical protein AB7I79_24340 [Rhizobiaceae bacterium]
MTSQQPTPRPEQIDALTRGLVLPLAPLDDEHLFLVADMLATAWDDLGRSSNQTLASGSEAEINALLAARLTGMLNEYPLWEQLVRCITRGTETVSFDGTHLEKRPDLSIHLTARTPAFPLLVECKLIDAPAGKTSALYCSHGLRRFLTGEYGWAIRESMMLAYVRDQSTTASCLAPFLIGSRSQEPEPYPMRHPPVTIARSALDLCKTSHDRAFRYVGREAPVDDPGPVAIWHIWLQQLPSAPH